MFRGSMQRRHFLGTLFSLSRLRPELILHNANFLTMDEGNARAEAVAIAGGRFLAVGSLSLIHISEPTRPY